MANAYAYSYSGKRETLVGEWNAFPFPSVAENRAESIERAADVYLAAVQSSEGTGRGVARRALLALDAEVLRLYDLPPRLERQLLELFRGCERKGVGCTFGDYFPAEFRPCVPLHEYISEDFRRSTAGEVAKELRPVRSQVAVTALDLAEKLAAGD